MGLRTGNIEDAVKLIHHAFTVYITERPDSIYPYDFLRRTILKRGSIVINSSGKIRRRQKKEQRIMKNRIESKWR